MKRGASNSDGPSHITTRRDLRPKREQTRAQLLATTQRAAEGAARKGNLSNLTPAEAEMLAHREARRSTG